jgi:hypothetical protein
MRWCCGRPCRPWRGVSRSPRTLADRYLRYAARRGYVRRLPRDIWQPERAEQAIHAALGEPGYHVAPLAYARNELDEMLAASAADAASEPRRASTGTDI